MATINYRKVDNLCKNQRNGFIEITQIILITQAENASFFNNIIEWSGDIDDDTIISTDNRLISNLKNGNYEFIIRSLIDNSILGPYTFNIESPPELKITGVQHKEYSCNNDANIYIEVSGGSPPYIYDIKEQTIVSSEPSVTIRNLSAGSYSVSVVDNNGCSVSGPSFLIVNTETQYLNQSSIPPTIFDGYGTLKFDITGYGPFSLLFTNVDDQGLIYFIDAFETKYITNVDTINNRYSYQITNLLMPGTYSLAIENSYGCTIVIDNIIIPNINPLSVSLKITEDIKSKLYSPIITLPIYDTILIPYKLISNNSALWQYIKTLKLKDNIIIKIDNNQYEFLIVRNMLDKYSIQDNEIEILKLGNSSEDWFYSFYIAPGLNPNANPNLLNSVLQITNPKTNEAFDLSLGLSEFGDIDNENASLVRGSFILQDNVHAQFTNSGFREITSSRMDNVYVSIGDNTNNEDFYQFKTTNTKKLVYKNLYQLNYVTILSFLEKFSVLNQYVTTSQTVCDSSPEDSSYILNIKNLLRSINKINNLSEIYVYNLDNATHTGGIDIVIDGNSSYLLPDNTTIDNNYVVNFYVIDNKSSTIKPLMSNNKLIDSSSIKGLSNGYIIIRIKDKYNNIPNNIIYNNLNKNYDNHFTISKKILQDYNKLVVDQFLYGDILVYVRAAGENTTIDEYLPQPRQIPASITTPVEAYQTIKQTEDETNTAKLLVNIDKPIKHTIYGPKNYNKTFAKNTLFINLLPGVYTIMGDEQELLKNNLYQNEYRILVEDNLDYSIDIIFNSYQDQIFIMDN